MPRTRGRCHLCGTPAKLTYEHVPPDRVQKLVDKRRYSLVNTIDLIEAHNKSKRRLPPARKFPAGTGRVSLCESCQQLTQKYYGQAFYDWSVQMLRYGDKLPAEPSIIVSLHDIEPLKVIKQIATMALAVHDFTDHFNPNSLRSFVLQPHDRHTPLNYEFYAYLNPVRVDYELPQSRLHAGMYMMDVVKGGGALVFADIAFPPMGYIVLIKTDVDRLLPEAAVLTNISQFGFSRFGEKKSFHMELPVRTPFGPAPLRFWQDAQGERK